MELGAGGGGGGGEESDGVVMRFATLGFISAC